MACGIYKIQNKSNGKSYIGQSFCIERRWKDEICDANNQNSHSYNYPLQRAFRKYGVENFTFEILEECDSSILNDREIYWVEQYDAFYNGYNQTLGGDHTKVAPKENIIGVFNDLKNTDLKHKEIAEKWHISIEMVQGINTGRYWHQSNIEYPIQTVRAPQNRTIHPNFCIKCGKEISRGATYCIECYNVISRVVERPSKEELYNFLVENNGNFTKAGIRYKVSDNAVRKWCQGYNIPSKSKDYKVAKEEGPGNTKPKKVAQIDLQTGKIIAKYDSLREAASSIGKDGGGSHIGAVCSGKRKSAYGFNWQFTE